MAHRQRSQERQTARGNARSATESTAVPATNAALQAEEFAGHVRELCLHASAEAGLVLCERLLREGESEFDLPSCAWRVLVRLVREWFGRGERGLEDYRKLREQDNRLVRYHCGPFTRTAKKDQRQELIRQLMDVGITNVARIKDELNSQFAIKVSLGTLKNDLTALRRKKTRH
jgi:hypothetical protein